MTPKNESGFHPTGDIVLVRVLPVAETSSGGIAMPQETRDREMMGQQYGTVIEMGELAPTAAGMRMKGVSIGQMVCFSRYAGVYETGLDGEKYRLIRAADVYAWRDAPPSERPLAFVSATKQFDMA